MTYTTDKLLDLRAEVVAVRDVDLRNLDANYIRIRKNTFNIVIRLIDQMIKDEPAALPPPFRHPWSKDDT